MISAVNSITRAATRRENEPLNILCMLTHPRYEQNICKTDNQFYAWRNLDDSIKDWDETNAKLPQNYTLLNPHLGPNQLLPWVELDLVLSQNKVGQYSIAKQISRQLQLPLITLEHTLPPPDWTQKNIKQWSSLRGDINIFISEYSKKKWMGQSEDIVINHTVDDKTFRPINNINKKRQCLSVVNDFIRRDVFCGYNLWENITKNIPRIIVGNTPGLSSPAKNVQELVEYYNEAQVFINTSIVSPIPMSLLEAMSCGTACVSTATCAIPDIIEHGYNGYISNNPQELRQYVLNLLDDPEKCRKFGENARKTIIEKFSMNRFLKEWNEIFSHAANIQKIWGVSE
jgi:hypothetical protein